MGRESQSGGGRRSKTSAEVLGYFVSPENLRVSLLPALAENPVVNEEALGALAVSGSAPVWKRCGRARR